MIPEAGDVPPDRSTPWRITHVGRRVRWSDATHTCAACGDCVELDSRHYYVSMSRSPPGRIRRRSDDELVFCRTRCLERWA